MRALPQLQAGDTVEVIAPASRCSERHLNDLTSLLASWQLRCIVNRSIFGDDLLCANSDTQRFQLLNNALQNTETKAIICARGGYGSMRLIPALTQVMPPAAPKLFVGMSDITALHLYLQRHWQWPTIHGSLSSDLFSEESIATHKSILFGEVFHVEWFGKPLNTPAVKESVIHSTLTGGNLSLVQASIGTVWQIQGENKIIFLEDTGERAYRVDRMLVHLQQAHVFKGALAIVLGDFIKGNEPNGSSLIQPVLERFAASCDIPVIHIEGAGHGPTNFPVLFGTRAQLQLGRRTQLRIFTGS